MTQERDGIIEPEVLEDSDERALVVVPQISVEALGRYMDEMDAFVRSRMKAGIDYGIIPGVNKPSLFKPGAEKLLKFFGLAVHMEDVERIIDLGEGRESGEPFFMFRKRAIATRIRDGKFICSASGSCNSWERKYRYRDSQRICPECSQPAIIRGKQEYGGGWLCFAKKGGCGAKFGEADPRIIDQQIGQVANPDIFDILNTIEKVAEKRTRVAVAISACNASEYFSQDMEDITVPPDTGKVGAARPDSGKTQVTRPFMPQALFDNMRLKVGYLATHGVAPEVTDDMRGHFFATWGKVAIPILPEGMDGDYARRCLSAYLFGVEHFNELSGPEVVGLTDYIRKSTEYIQAELTAVIAVVERERRAAAK